MSFTKEETAWYTRRLYRFLKGGHSFLFGKSTVYRGWIDDYRDEGHKTAVVFLDPRSSVISTLIHEFLHYQHPEWSETEVLRVESKIINSLTERQVKNIVKRFAEAL